MKHTLIAFQCSPADMKTPGGQPYAGESTPLGIAVEQSKAHRAEVCAGIYVYETVRGYANIHHLRECLRVQGKPFVELQFEGALLGLFPPAISEALKSIGVESCEYGG